MWVLRFWKRKSGSRSNISLLPTVIVLNLHLMWLRCQQRTGRSKVNNGQSGSSCLAHTQLYSWRIRVPYSWTHSCTENMLWCQTLKYNLHFELTTAQWPCSTTYEECIATANMPHVFHSPMPVKCAWTHKYIHWILIKCHQADRDKLM